MAKKNKSTYQLDLFCDSDNLYKIIKPIRLIEFFAGVGFQRMGIEKVFPNLESWKICEWAIPSILAYDAVHTNYDDPGIKENEKLCKSINKDTLVRLLLQLGVSKDYNVPATEKELMRIPHDKLVSIYLSIINTHNLVNIMNVKGGDLEIVDTDKYEYVLTYSFPCQDLSLANKTGFNGQKGMKVSQVDGGTRSGLVWEIVRILKECENKPQLLLMENVPQIHSKDNNGEFYFLQTELQKLGYKNFWQDMNAKHYGIPQNRDRTFMLSILDKNADYVFPEPEPLKKTLQDLLEDNVDESYYLSEKMVEFISTEDVKHNGSLQPALVNKSIATTTTTREGNTRAQESNYICDDLPLNTDLKTLKIKNANSKGFLEAKEGDGIDISTRMQYHRGTVQRKMAQTLTTMGGENVGVVVNELETEKAD